MKLHLFFLALILLLAFILRFYSLGEVPMGIHEDEESHGYNAYSILKTGKDRYGEPFPILFRSFGSYQPPVYTYLGTITIALFGNSIASIRFVSAAAGVLLVLITYFFIINFFNSNKKEFALISGLIVAISPWSIYYSRGVVEGNLGVMLFSFSLLLFLFSLRKIWIFPLAVFTLAFSTHAYYSERIISIILLPAFILIFRKHLLKYKMILFIGIIIFIVAMLPHLFILTSGAFTKRLVQVGYIGSTTSYFDQFLQKYLIYFSPRNLFFDLGEALNRMPPGLGVFYTFFIIPFFVGITKLKNYLQPDLFKIFVILILITPVSAALTSDSYYPLRSLDLIWLFTLIISLGVFTLVRGLSKYLRFSILLIFTTQCLFIFYAAYFVLFKYENAKNYDSAYLFLIEQLQKYQDKKIIIDSSRHPGAGLRIAYLTSYNPISLQRQLRPQLNSSYYSSDVSIYESYNIDNIQVKKVDWGEVECNPNVLLIGDNLTISEKGIKEHNLEFEFEVKDISGYDGLVGYRVIPSKKCYERTLQN